MDFCERCDNYPQKWIFTYTFKGTCKSFKLCSKCFGNLSKGYPCWSITPVSGN